MRLSVIENYIRSGNMSLKSAKSLLKGNGILCIIAAVLLVIFGVVMVAGGRNNQYI